MKRFAAFSFAVVLLSVSSIAWRTSPVSASAGGGVEAAPGGNPGPRWWAATSSGPRIDGGSEAAEYGLLFGGCARYLQGAGNALATCVAAPGSVNANGTATTLGDTWIWTGGSWLKVTDSPAPAPRWGAAMAYDPATKKTVLFGGCCKLDSSIPPKPAVFSDTWVFDWNACSKSATSPRVIDPASCSWQQVSTATTPPARALTGMAFDGSGGAIMYGGYSGTDPEATLASPSSIPCTAVLADTWRWNFATSAWSQPVAAPNACVVNGTPGTPLPVWGHAMARASGLGQLMIYGGVLGQGVYPLPGNAGGILVQETWLWNGTGWVAPNTPTYNHYYYCMGNNAGECSAPHSRFGVTLLRDESTGKTVLFGGCAGGSAPVGAGGCQTWNATVCGWANTTPNCMYQWNGSSWTSVSAGQIPSPRMGTAAISGRSPVLFGGFDNHQHSMLRNDTYRYRDSGPTWIGMGAWEPSWMPKSTLDAAGYTTWDYPNGMAETRVWHSTGPAARSGASMVDDGEKILMFGGRNEPTLGDVDDTWAYKDGAWVNLVPGLPGAPNGSGLTRPSARSDAGMVGLGNGRALLFGGAQVVSCGGYCRTYLNDAWLWNGTAWAQVSVSGTVGAGTGCAPGGSKPAGRANPGLAYDPTVGKAVVYGGGAEHPVGGGGKAFCDTWVLSLNLSNPSAPTGTWTQACGTDCPLGTRTGVSMGYQPDAGVTLAFGGMWGWVFWGDTWVGDFLPNGQFVWLDEELCYDPNEVENGVPEAPQCFTSPQRTQYASQLAYNPATKIMAAFGGYGGEARSCAAWYLQCTLKVLEYEQLQVASGLQAGSSTIVLSAAPSEPIVPDLRLVLSGGTTEIVQVETYDPVTRTISLTAPIAYAGHTAAHMMCWEDETPPPINPCKGCYTYTQAGPPVWWPSPVKRVNLAYDRSGGSFVLFGGDGQACSTTGSQDNPCSLNQPLGGTWTVSGL